MTEPGMNHAVLRQVAAHLRNGDIKRCLDLGFREEELSLINSLSLGEINHLSAMPVQFVQVSINHEVLQRALERLQEDNDRQALIQRAIALGATIDMLTQLFGMTASEVSARRRLQGVTSKQGRLAMPPVEETHSIWHRWKELCEGTNLQLEVDPIAALDIMMMLAEETGHTLSVIWKLAHSWAQVTNKGSTGKRNAAKGSEV